MTDYLRQKWQLLRIFRSRNTFEINYRILRNTEKLMGIKHAGT